MPPVGGPSGMRSLHKPASTVIVLAILMAAGSAAVGVASAATEELWVPGHSPGDAWTYRVAQDDGRRTETWQWADVEAARMNDGTAREVRFLEQTVAFGDEVDIPGFDGSYTARYGYDRSAELVVGQFDWDAVGRAASFGMAGLGVRSEAQAEGRVEVWPITERLCPLPVMPQEAVLDEGTAVQIMCIGAEQWTPTGQATIGDMDAWGFSHDVFGEAWFASGLSVPVRWDGPSGEYRLERFAWGDGAWSWGVQGERGIPWGPVDVAPLQPWGPDDAGLDHPYPLSRAYRDAIGDPSFGELQEYLDDHPDAEVVAGLMQQFRGEGHGDWVSTFAISDGDRMFAWAAVHRVDEKATTLVGGALGRTTDLHSQVAYTAQEYEHPRGLPLPDERPAVLPTAASVLARDEQAHGPDAAHPSWGFQAVCVGGCDEVRWWVFGGTIETDQDYPQTYAATLAPLGPVHQTAHLAFADDLGRTLMLADADAVLMTSVDAATTQPQEARLDGSPPAEARLAYGLSGLAVLVAAITAAASKLKGGLVGLFSRLMPSQVEQHPARAKIMEAVRAQPGIHMNEVGRITGLRGGNLDHHVRYLERSERLKLRSMGGYTCLFPPDVGRAVVEAAPALRHPTARQVMSQIEGRPGVTAKEVAEALRVAPSTVAHHVQRLRDCGVIEARRDGRTVRLAAATS